MFNKKDLKLDKYYDRFHDRLEEEHTHIYEPTFRLRKKFQADIIKRYDGTNKHALDMGCGTGHATAALLAQGFSVDAVDPAPKAIATLKKKCDGNRNIHFYTASLHSFKPKQKYDLIVCYEVLEHIKDDYRALHHLVTWLKEDGIIIIDVPLHPHLYSKADELCGHYRRYTIGRMASLLKRAKLSEVKRYYFGFPLIYASKIIRKLFQKKNVLLVQKLSHKPSKNMNRLLKLYEKLLFIDKHQFSVPLADDIIVIAKKY